MGIEISNIQKSEELVDKLQFFGMIPGPQKYFVQFFTSNAGVTTSVGDLVDKINKGTATRNDYIDVAKDIASFGASVAGFTALVMGSTTLALPILTGIGIGLAVLDYLDSKDYKYENVQTDIDGKRGQATLNNKKNFIKELTKSREKKRQL